MSAIAVQRPSIARLSIGGVIAIASWLVGFAMIGGDLLSLVHVSSAIVVAAGPVLIAIVSRFNMSWQVDGRMLNVGNAAIAAGVVGTIIGLIHVMENLDKPDQIGIGIAVAILAMLYGMVTYFLLAPLASRDDQSIGVPKTDIAFYGMLSFTLLISVTFVVLYAINLQR